MNSTLQYIKSDSLFAYVVTVIRGHKQDGRVVVVVEGDFDKKVYRQFYPHKSFDVVFYEKQSGHEHFMELCEALKDFCKRFCVIKDADFDRLNNVSYGFPNLFLTDTHDLETMMLTEKFYNVITSKYGLSDANSLVENAIHAILHLSYIKWMNNVHKTGYCFDKINVGHCYNGVRPVNIKNWVDYIRENNFNNGQISSLNEMAVQAFEGENPLGDNEFLQITNGHDLVAAMERRFHIRTKLNIGKDNLERLLSESFTIDEYKETGLCREIDIWLKSIRS